MKLTTRVRPLFFENNALILLDQTLLPTTEVHVRCTTVSEVADAISTMKVRGAPAIGISAAYGMVLACRELGGSTHSDINSDNRREMLDKLLEAGRMLEATRPTAVNLAWAVRRMLAVIRQVIMEEQAPTMAAVEKVALTEATRIEEEDREMCEAMGLAALELLPKEPEKISILTHCNAGALATGGVGTALGVVRAVHAAGRLERLYADETRPFLQGARLTAWEAHKDDIPVTLQADVGAASLLATGKVHMVVVGADRIAANGDTANKVGTFGLAIVANWFKIPVVVAAPTSTLDLNLSDGTQIPIEERPAREVEGFGGVRTSPEGIGIRNPSFDVTPASLIAAIVTEQGVARPPFAQSLRRALEKAGRP